MSVQNNAKWYILHTYSGYESLVKKSIEQMVENGNLQDVILDTKIPTETLIEEKNGKKKAYEAKVMPCYVFVKLVYSNELWFMLTNTRGVTGFVGPGSKPVPLTDEEMMPLGIKKDNIVVDFDEGDTIVVTGGVWKDTVGVIQTMNHGKQIVTINVELFGRETPVEISFAEVKKMN